MLLGVTTNCKKHGKMKKKRFPKSRKDFPKNEEKVNNYIEI